MSVTPEGTTSPDGAWRWQGGQWVPNIPELVASAEDGRAPHVPSDPPRKPRRLRPVLVLAAAVLLILGVVAAVALTGSADGPAAENVSNKLDCDGRDLTEDEGEEHNKIWLCVIDAHVENISTQADLYPTLTQELVNACVSDEQRRPRSSCSSWRKSWPRNWVSC